MEKGKKKHKQQSSATDGCREGRKVAGAAGVPGGLQRRLGNSRSVENSYL
jgi:hypothetical protein